MHAAQGDSRVNFIRDADFRRALIGEVVASSVERVAAKTGR